MAELREIEAQLKVPFALEDIDFLPKGKIEREGKTLCMALPYADPRVYQDRLNAIAYGEWSTPAPVVVVAGNKLICYVTVILCGVAHTDVGEATNNEENTGTEAWAQAFKRACSQFGLGRYLYDLEKEWVLFNPQRKVIDLDPAQKQAVVRKMYQKAGIALPGSNGKALHSLTAPGSYEQHEANGQQDTVAITRGDLYATGEAKGLWSRTSPEKFYAWASSIAARPQSKTAWDMTISEMGEMAKRIYAEPGIKASAGVGK